MNRIVPALVVIALAAGACTDAQSGLFVQGVLIPLPGDAQSDCHFKPGAAQDLRTDARNNPRVMALVDGTLSQYIGYQLQNTLQSPVLAGPNGTTANINKDDVLITEADVTLTDLQGNSVASETLAVDGYIPANGSGAVIPNIMGKPVTDALLALAAFPAKPTTTALLLSVTFKGDTISGSPIAAEPFTFPFKLDAEDPFAVRIGNTGAVQTVALLPDGGHADEVIFADGTSALGDPISLVDGGVGATDGGTAFSDAAVSKAQALAFDPDGGGFPFTKDCE